MKTWQIHIVCALLEVGNLSVSSSFLLFKMSDVLDLRSP